MIFHGYVSLPEGIGFPAMFDYQKVTAQLNTAGLTLLDAPEIDKSGRLAVADMLDIPFQVR